MHNLVAGTLRSPDESTIWLRPFASFYLNVKPKLFTDNLAAGSEDVGIVVIPDACGTTSRAFFDNEAHGAVVGIMLLSVRGDCVEAYGLTAFKSSHIGILTVDQLSNVHLVNAVVADNHIGISLNFVRGGYGFARVSNSVIMGSTSASADCSQSTVCRAMDKEDPVGVGCNSVYGTGWRRVGVMTTQYTNLGKTCGVSGGLAVCRPPTTPERMCGMPWEKRYGLPLDIDSADLVRSGASPFYFSQPSA